MQFDPVLTVHPLPQHTSSWNCRENLVPPFNLEYMQLLGLDEQEALNQVRTIAWGHLRDMGAVDMAKAKRQRFYYDEKGTSKGKHDSSSSKGWYNHHFLLTHFFWEGWLNHNFLLVKSEFFDVLIRANSMFSQGTRPFFSVERNSAVFSLLRLRP